MHSGQSNAEASIMLVFAFLLPLKCFSIPDKSLGGGKGGDKYDSTLYFFFRKMI